MVFSRSDVKRRNKYTHDLLGENPKRIKVHAQRKFAQGSGMNSPVMTPIKEKEKIKPNGAPSPPEILPTKRPNTEDFLNFLCFRGTNVLPPRLDFFNEGTFGENTEPSVSSTSKQSSTTSSGVQKIKTKNSSNQDIKKKILDRPHGVTKGNAMRARTASDERQSIRKKTIELRRRAEQRRSKPIRKTHPAILKRLGAARLRSGLRSGGQLPPGSDIGIKSDRKPRRGRPPRRKRFKVLKKGSPDEDTKRKIKDESKEDSDEEEEEDEEDEEEEEKVYEKPERPSKLSSMMKLRTRSSNSPAQPPKTLNISTRPSRKTKEAATLYMEMLTKDLRSPDEEDFDEDFIKNLPDLPSTVKKEKEEDVSDTPVKKTRQQVKEGKARPGRPSKESLKAKVKEEVESDLDEENEPLLTRTQKNLKKDNIKGNVENKRISLKMNDLKQEDTSKNVKRSVGKRELRALKERKVLNDDEDTTASDIEEVNSSPGKGISKRNKEERSDTKVPTETASKQGSLKKNDHRKSLEIVKKNVKENKKGRKLQNLKSSIESDDEIAIPKKKKGLDNDFKVDKSEDTVVTGKTKTTERRKLRKQADSGVDQSTKCLEEPKGRPGKRSSSLNNDERTTRGTKLAKDVIDKVKIKSERESESEEDEENEPLIKRRQRLSMKDHALDDKKTGLGRSLRSSEPKTDNIDKDSPQKPGRKSLRGNKYSYLDKNDEKEDECSGKSKATTPSKKLSEEKMVIKEPICKKEVPKSAVEATKKSRKEANPKRGKRIFSLNNDEEEDSMEEIINESIGSERNLLFNDKGLDITNRVNITEIRSKKLTNDETDLTSSVKMKDNKVTKKIVEDVDLSNKVKITDVKMKKVTDEKVINIDCNAKPVDDKMSDRVLDEDKNISNTTNVIGKSIENKASKRSIDEGKGINLMNKVKFPEYKSVKNSDDEKGMNITNKVKMSDLKASKNIEDSEKETPEKKIGNLKRSKNFDVCEPLSNKESDQKKKKKINTENNVSEDKNKSKRATRLSSGGSMETEDQDSGLMSDKKLKVINNSLSQSVEEKEKSQNLRPSSNYKNHTKEKDVESKPVEFTPCENIKLALTGKRKSGGDRDSCDTVHSGSSGLVDCKVVVESITNVSKDIQRPLKKLKTNLKPTNFENNQAVCIEEKQVTDNISNASDSNSNPNIVNSNVIELVKIEEKRENNKDEAQKPKQSITETWRQAFKNAKIPKPGQLSPVPHSVKPFVRQKLVTSTLGSSSFSGKFGDTQDSKSSDSNKSQKSSPSLSPFKAMLANQNQRSVSPDVKKSSSPAHKVNFGGRDSPLKKSDEVRNDLKRQETPVKTFTQLQYEKRSSEFINSLLDPGPSILPGFDSIKPFKKEVKKDEIKELKAGDISDNLSTSSEPVSKPPPEGKHLNLPLAVEHTLRKMSPVTVSKKPVIVKPVIAPLERKNDSPQLVKQINAPTEIKIENPSNNSASPSASASCSLPSREIVTREPSDIRKKVNMTAEEITRWLNDSTSSGIEHKKDCGIFENNQCECGCGFRTCKDGMENSVGMSELVGQDDGKVDHGVVEPPVQLKELDQGGRYEAETISTCKVEDYKEKLLTKSCSPDHKMAPPKPRKSFEKFKSNRSMTDEEMCDYDFRFERASNSPRESMSDLSSITPRDDASSSSEVPERKIFQQRRTGAKRPSLSKSPCAFSAENESSVYAFKPDPPSTNKPFRRGRGKSGENEEGCPSSSSIAVQVNIDTEPVLECSTQTDRDADENEGHLFFIPLPVGQVEKGLPQGVAVKLDTEGPEQRVVMRAKLVTKPTSSYSLPSSSRALVTSGRNSSHQKPEQKVRPLWSGRAPIGTVQPTLREQWTSDQGTTTGQEKAQSLQPSLSNQSTSNQNSPKGPDSPRLKNISKPQKVDEFPLSGTPPTLVEAPTFYPTEKEFQDPLDYIEQLTPLAQSFGICRIVPPSNFKPECKVNDEMRFTAYNQYVHKMMERWGPNVREMSAIRKYLRTQSISLVQVPSIGSMEVDLPRLYQTVQQCGGLKEVIEKKRWAKVADAMRIPKSAQDRVTKLDDIYCKYLLPYDTLSHGERNKLLEEVEAEWLERQKKLAAADEESESGDNSSDESETGEHEECIAKGRSMPLSAFYRTARNTMAMWFKDGTPSAADVEAEYWKHVSQKTCHVCVHSGSIDSGTWGYGFPTTKTSATSRHPWNLKVLTNSPGSILRSLGPVIGITVPTLHVGMLFSSCCWYRDPHALPWIEYLHTGASKIWYGVPDSWCSELRQAMYPLLPRHTRDRTIWLPSDSLMVPPNVLLEGGVSLCRVVQEPGQFILVFPKAFTSSISTGYVVSESVYFAQPSWLNTAIQVFKDIQDSCEPPVFSLQKLLFNIANDTKSSGETLMQVLPMVEAVVEKEVESRKKLEKLGLTSWEKIPSSKGRRSKKQEEDPSDLECDTCRGALFLSMVTNSNEDCSYCIDHAIEALTRDQGLLKYCTLRFAYDEEEMEELIEKVKSKIETKTQKKQAKEKGNSSGAKN